MQIRGKILTIAGIILMFGYFIKDSLNSYDPTQVVMIGNDTLGRDWGALAEQVAKDKMQQSSDEDGVALQTIESDSKVGTISKSSDKGASINSETEPDPFTRQKFNQNNYSSIESPDGREIITGYDRPEDPGDEYDPNNDSRRYKTRHQIETEEPEMKYRD